MARLYGAALLLLLGVIGFLQVGWSLPVAAAASSTGVFTWGDNSIGELGNGTTGGFTVSPMAAFLPAGVTPTAITGGGDGGSINPESPQYAGYAIGSDGNLYSWGDNSKGALGDGNTSSSNSPVTVSLPSGVTPTAITAAQGVGFAIGSDGNLYAWGDNFFGLLGDSTTTDSGVPVVVSLPSGVTPTEIAGGFETAYAIGLDGNLYAWGDNFYGELGNGGISPDNCDGSAICSTMPVRISLAPGVTPKAIAGSAYAIGSDGNLYAWGYNVFGGLGNGSTLNSSTPVVVALPSGVTPTAIAGGTDFAYAVGSDGHLYAWGEDNDGQFGDGDTTNTDTPVLASLPSGVIPSAIAAANGAGYAIGSDGRLYAWGSNANGQLGNGGWSNSDLPVPASLPTGSVPSSPRNLVLWPATP